MELMLADSRSGHSWKTRRSRQKTANQSTENVFPPVAAYDLPQPDLP